MRIFHVSDLHFGHSAVPEQIDAIEDAIQAERFDVVAISGDVSQRARAGEFLRARAFIRDAQKVSKVVCVPGNHDVAWWMSPFGVRRKEHVYAGYRRFVNHDLEPVLRVDGATIAGVNTSHGVTVSSLTWNMRDLSVIGYVKKEQIERLAAAFEKSSSGDLRVVLMHHNPVKGELSQRHGLRNTKQVLNAFESIGVDLVMCGHDHQEAVHYVEHTRRGTVISTAGTVSNRSRGGRPSSVNVITISPSSIDVQVHVWSSSGRKFEPGVERCFVR
ncbi:MAG TPA: metallophosphoesterase [Gemmatimonadales bacterium]|nr:metallophosphoesterase [Gemmatimonadales bacterium]